MAVICGKSEMKNEYSMCLLCAGMKGDTGLPGAKGDSGAPGKNNKFSKITI